MSSPKKDNTLAAYETDASMIQGNATGVVFPESSEEISRIIKSGSNFVIRGGGSGLVGGCVPQNSMVIDMSKMNKIIKLYPGKRLVEVEAGVIVDELNDEVKKFNLEFPVKPSSHAICTLGGMIATNAVGNRAVKYGRTSEWVDELEVVNGNGEIMILKKTDLNDFTGMEGITGVIVKAKLKLAELKKRTASVMPFSDLRELVETAVKLKLRSDVSELEFLDKLSSSLLGFGESYNLIVEFESEDGKIKGQDYAELMEKRHTLYPTLAKLGYTRIEDPKIMLNRFIELAQVLESGNIPFFGHLGVGIVHPVFRQDEQEKIAKIYDYVKKLHGQVSGEHGIGMTKKQFIEPNDKKLIIRIKKRHDPLCKINCGKVIDCSSGDVEDISERAKERIESAEKIIDEQNSETEQNELVDAVSQIEEIKQDVEENGKTEGIHRLLAMIVEPIWDEYDRLRDDIRYSPGRHRNYHTQNIEHIHAMFGRKFWRTEDGNS